MRMKWYRLLGKVFVFISAVFFIQAGIKKLQGTEQMGAMIQELGFPVWFLVVIGLLEVIGGIALLIPKISRYAVLGLGVLMIGAVISHLINGQMFEAIIPGQWLIVLVLIWVLTARTLKR